MSIREIQHQKMQQQKFCLITIFRLPQVFDPKKTQQDIVLDEDDEDLRIHVGWPKNHPIPGWLF